MGVSDLEKLYRDDHQARDFAQAAVIRYPAEFGDKQPIPCQAERGDITATDWEGLGAPHATISRSTTFTIWIKDHGSYDLSAGLVLDIAGGDTYVIRSVVKNRFSHWTALCERERTDG